MPFYAYQGVAPAVDPSTYVSPEAVLIGDVLVGPGGYIAPGAVLRGDMGRLVVEAGSNIQDNCTLHGGVDLDMVVGENGHIGHGAVLHGCVLEADVLVGVNAVVLDGARVGTGSLVGAGALAPMGMRIPPRSLVLGAPARVKRTLTDADLEDKRVQTRGYQRLARHALGGLLTPCEPDPRVDLGRPRPNLAYLTAAADVDPTLP